MKDANTIIEIIIGLFPGLIDGETPVDGSELTTELTALIHAFYKQEGGTK